MILSDVDIKNSIVKGGISIQPFNPENLTPNGYDLSVGEIMVDGERKDKAVIQPMKWFAIGTLEYIKLGTKAAQLWLRSTYARKGVISSFGKVDVGFEGTLTISCFNTKEEITISSGERVCQIVFEEVKSKSEKSYEGKYKGQKKIKLE
ncbi:MAG: dCTP deaminase [Candidatus Thermoplasmatota archaeon]|nr:dCTP deaminase [Candidatus Thermoplasmatota archaeon]